MSVDELVVEVLNRGVGTELTKADVSREYRNVPVHPEDRSLLGMEWEGQVYVDGTLPFGLRSASLLFTALGDAVQWRVERSGVVWPSHYIDDFVTVGGPGMGERGRNLSILKETCERWGLPLDKEKEDGPATAITFLGIEVDALAGELRLPASKLAELVSLVKRWRGRKSCRKRELLSIIGSLSHACKVVLAGRSFLRRLIDLAATVKYLDRRVRLNQAASADLRWWWQFGTRWDGVGGWGCGAEWDGRWFQILWQGLCKTEFQYHGKGAAAHSGGCSNMGPVLGGKSGKGPMRQHVGGGHGQLRFM